MMMRRENCARCVLGLFLVHAAACLAVSLGAVVAYSAAAARPSLGVAPPGPSAAAAAAARAGAGAGASAGAAAAAAKAAADRAVDGARWGEMLSFFTYFVLLNTLVPLALGISLDIVRFTQDRMLYYVCYIILYI